MFAVLHLDWNAGATLGWMNSGTAKRSTWCPMGDESVEAVRDANLFMSRMACLHIYVLSLIASCGFVCDAMQAWMHGVLPAGQLFFVFSQCGANLSLQWKVFLLRHSRFITVSSGFFQ